MAASAIVTRAGLVPSMPPSSIPDSRCLVHLHRGGLYHSVHATRAENRIGTDTSIAFVAEDVKATWRELAAKGVTFVQEPQEADWGIASMFVDPDGNHFVLGSG